AAASATGAVACPRARPRQDPATTDPRRAQRVSGGGLKPQIRHHGGFWNPTGTKSPEDNPWRYSSGNTSVIFGVLRHHGGRIAEANRARSPVSGSVRRSLTRGATTSTAPAE